MEAERGARSDGGSASIQTEDKEYAHGLYERGAIRSDQLPSSSNEIWPDWKIYLKWVRIM